MTGTGSLGDRYVNRLGYGAMQLPGLGVWGPPRDRDTALRLLRTALELGVDHIDTSAAYGPHVANELIRDALHPYPDQVVVATKVGVIRDGTGGWHPAAAPEQLRDQVEENLRRLRLDRLDLVYLRVGGDGLLAPDPTPLTDSYQALADLRDKGLIRHLGLSGATAAQVADAGQVAPVVAVQNRYHLLDTVGEDVLATCERRGIAFVPYFPLGAGQLTTHPRLATVAARYGATPAQVAIAWLLHRSPVVLAIPGTSSPEHLAENVAAGALRLTDADLALLHDR
jgi:aryl-alcohol dehydrogenase-like predicted oxidoreductase